MLSSAGLFRAAETGGVAGGRWLSTLVGSLSKKRKLLPQQGDSPNNVAYQLPIPRRFQHNDFVGRVFDSVVKVYATVSPPNYFLPWTKKPQRDGTGSGFTIAGKSK